MTTRSQLGAKAPEPRAAATGLTGDESALVEAATEARLHAYAPYSRFRVGAAARLDDGRIVCGINVENASFGLAVCAERNAIAAAVLCGAVPGRIVALAVVADADDTVTPCGACRQVIAEFMPADAPLIMYNLRDGAVARYSVAELLPHAFVADRLPAK